MSGLLVLAVAAAVAFAWTNGVHDAANAIATSLSTGALTPRIALGMAALLNGLGALLGVDVALTISERLVRVPAGRPGIMLVLAALLAAIAWNALTWWLGLLDALGGFAAQASSAVVLYVAGALGAPISSTQTVTGSVAGAGAAVGVRVVRWGLFRRTLLTWVLTPVVCGAAAALVQLAAG